MRLIDNCTGGFRFLVLVWIIDAKGRRVTVLRLIPYAVNASKLLTMVN
jgi:hypothetical protein